MEQEAKSVKSFQREQVVSIINSVIGKVRRPEGLPRDAICNELHALKDSIEDLRHQLGTASGDINGKHIPLATDELDAVVAATEAATNTIMDACERIMEDGDNATLRQRAEEQVVRIFEACTFQDIAGQRIAKVVRTLKVIDERVGVLLNALDIGGGMQEKPAETVTLLNGPALPQDAVSQEEIDRILASF